MSVTVQPPVSLWACRRFEILYRDVVLPLIRRSEFQRCRARRPNPTAVTTVGQSYVPTMCLEEETSDRPYRIRRFSARTEDPSSAGGGKLGSSGAHAGLIERNGLGGGGGDGTPYHSRQPSDAAASVSDLEVIGEEQALGEDDEIRHLWDLLVQELSYFVRPLGHSRASGTKGGELPATASSQTETMWATCCQRDREFGQQQLLEATESRTPELLRIASALEMDEKRKTQADTASTLSALDTAEAIALRQSIVNLLVDRLSIRVNLHQVECLHLLSVTIQTLYFHLPPALGLEACAQVAGMTAGTSAAMTTNLSVSPFGLVVLDSCCARFRREQLFNLLCLQELALDLYPVDQSGVSMTEAVGLIPFSFFHSLVQQGFLANCLAALEFLMFESTRQYAPMGLGGTSEKPTSLDVHELTDRVWSRRLAHLLGRVLYTVVMRFHPPPSVVFDVAKLLAGSAFHEQAIANVQRGLCQKGSSDDTLRNHDAIVTTKDFDFIAVQDAKEGETLEDVMLEGLQPQSASLEMSAMMSLIFMTMIDPTVVKWSVEMKASVAPPRLEDVELPTAQLAEWLPNQLSASRGAGSDGWRSVSADPNTSWLAQKVADHDAEPFFLDSCVYGNIVAFAIAVAFSRPSGNARSCRLLLTFLDRRRLQQSLSSSGSVFAQLKTHFLDQLGGTTALSKLALQTLNSVVQHALLPLNSQWAQVVRTEKLARLVKLRSRRKLKGSSSSFSGGGFDVFADGQQHSSLEPVVAVMNRLCAMHPPAVQLYAPIFFSLVDSFPWLDLAGHDLVGVRQDDDSEATAGLSGKTRSHQLLLSANRALGTEVDLCELGTGGFLDEEVPSISGVGFPIDVTPVRGSGFATGLHGVQSTTLLSNGTPKRTAPRDETLEDDILHPDDIHFLLPLFIEVIQFGATICGVGTHAIASQVATKLTIQPSLLGFFLPNTFRRLQALFSAAFESGRLQRQILCEFQQRRGRKLMRLRRGEFGPGFVESGQPGVFSSFLEDADEEQEDRRIREGIASTSLSILASFSAVISFLVAASSPRLFLTHPAPDPLLPQDGPYAITSDIILHTAYGVLCVQRPSMGEQYPASLLSTVQLLRLKCAILEGFAASFRTQNRLEATQLLVAFVHDTLPMLEEDLTYLQTDPALAGDGSRFLRNATRELAGRLSIDIVAYFTTLLMRLGYRYRYSNFQTSRPATVTPDYQPFSINEQASERLDPTSALMQKQTLLTMTKFVMLHIIPLLHTSSLQGTLPSHLHWRLAALSLRFLRCVLRGPLPLLGIPALDRVTREPFLDGLGSAAGPPTVSDTFTNVSEGEAATAWLMRAFLVLDSLAFTALMHLTRAAWQSLLSPWDTGESPAGVFQLQTVEVGLSILKILFQRDSLFLAWWENLRHQSLLSQCEEAAEAWSFVSELVPIHEHLMSDAMPTKKARKSSVTTWGTKKKGRLDTVQHAVFLFEFVLSEKHRRVRHLGLYLFLQMNRRDPERVAILLQESPRHVAMLQVVVASLLRDMELEDFESWEHLDTLGLLENSDFPAPGVPNSLLAPYWLDDGFEDPTSGDQDALLDARRQDARAVWLSPHCLELSTFQEEISEVDFPAAFHDMPLPNDDVKGERKGSSASNDHVHGSDGTTSGTFFSLTSSPFTRTESTCPVFSKYTGLPIHKKLDTRINLAEDIAMASNDTVAWTLALRHLVVKEQYKEWVAAASLQSLVALKQAFFLPVIGAAAVEGPRAPLFEEALLQLKAPGGTLDTSKEDVSSSAINVLSAAGFADACTSRLLCLQLLRGGLHMDADTSYTSVALQLLGLSRHPAACFDTLGTRGDVFTTSIPLPLIPSPFVASIESGAEVEANPWLKNPLIVLDSLCLIVENVEPWLGDPSGTRVAPHPDLTDDEVAVQEVLADPINYSADVVRLYNEGLTTLLSLEVLRLLLAHEKTVDVAMYLLFARLPHRHAILCQLLAAPYMTLPALLRPLKKLIASEWSSLLAHEIFLCSTYLSRQTVTRNRPSWPLAAHPSELFRARLAILHNQCRQALDGAWALLQTPSFHVDGSLEAMGVSCPQGTPTLTAFLLSHLGAFERVASLSNLLRHRSSSDMVLTRIFQYCSVPLSLFQVRDQTTTFHNASHLLRPHAVLLLWSQGLLKEEELCLDSKIFYTTATCDGTTTTPSEDDDDDAPFPDLLAFSFDFNLRALTVLAAQRMLCSLTELIATAAEVVIVDMLTHATGLLPVIDLSSPVSLTAAREAMEVSLCRCLEALEGHALRSGRSRYALVSTLGTLSHVFARLVRPSTSDAEDPSKDVPLNQAISRSIVERLFRLCIAGTAETQAESQHNGSMAGCLDRTLRLRVYLALLEFLRMTDAIQPVHQLLLELGQDDKHLLSAVTKQLLDDLLDVEPPDRFFGASPTHNRLNCQPMDAMTLNCQNDRFLKFFYPGLILTASRTAGPLLKMLIDSAPPSRYFPLRRGGPHHHRRWWTSKKSLLPGHQLHVQTDWWSSADLLPQVQSWVARILMSLEDTRGRGGSGESRGHDSRVLATDTGVDIIKLVLTVIGSLLEKPALCDAILAPSLPLRGLLPADVVDLTTAPLMSMCRTAIFSCPFFPKLNTSFSSEDFGFVVETGYGTGTTLRGNKGQRDPVNSKRHHGVGLPERGKTAKPVALLPIYLATLDRLIERLEVLDISLILEESSSSAFLGQDLPKTLVTIPAYLAVFRWWLARDRQMSSCFACFNAIVRHMARSSEISNEDASKLAALGNSLGDLSLRETPTGLDGVKDVHHDIGDVTALDDVVTPDTLRLTAPSMSTEKEHTGVVSLHQQFEMLVNLMVSTTHVWRHLLDTLIQKGGLSAAAAALAQPNASFSWDDMFLMFNFQTQSLDAAVTLCQLETWDMIFTCHPPARRVTSTTSFRSEALRVLLPPLTLTFEAIQIVLPLSTTKRLFLTTTLKAVELELEAVLDILHSEEQGGSAQFHQIREQLKRFLLARAQTLVLITNAAFLGLLINVPLSRRLTQLLRDIENLLGFPRPGTRILTSEHVLDDAMDLERTIFSLRVLNLALPLFLSVVDTILKLEEISFDVASTAPLPPDDSALLSHALNGIHPSLTASVMLRTTRYCCRAAGALSELRLAETLKQGDRELVGPWVVPSTARSVSLQCMKLESLLVHVVPYV